MEKKMARNIVIGLLGFVAGACTTIGIQEGSENLRNSFYDSIHRTSYMETAKALGETDFTRKFQVSYEPKRIVKIMGQEEINSLSLLEQRGEIQNLTYVSLAEEDH